MLRTMDGDASSLLIAILRCYQDAFISAEMTGACKEYYEKCLLAMNAHIEEVLEMAE